MPPPFPFTKILFVCSMNVCRSTTMKAVFDHLAKEAGVQENIYTDSCGVSSAAYGGRDPDPNSVQICREHGISLEDRSRQFEPSDLKEFDLIIVAEPRHRDFIKTAGTPKSPKQILCFMELLGESDGVADPYETAGGFEEMFQTIHKGSKVLLNSLVSGYLP